MTAVEDKQVIVPEEVINTGTLYIFQVNGLLAVIFDADSSCNDVQILQYPIVEVYIKKMPGILQGDDQSIGFGLFGFIDCRKPRKCVFAFLNLKIFET